MDEEILIPSPLPLYPLPEVVLFPHSVLPLHVDEPRYCRLIADVLAGEHILGIALLKPGFEPEYFTPNAPIHPVIGIGQIIASEQVEQGSYNILVRGIARAGIVEEVPHKPYRLVRVETIDPPAQLAPANVEQVRDELRQALETECVQDSEVPDYWRKLFTTDLEVGDIADLIASGLRIDAELRQSLLAEPDPVARARELSHHLRILAAVNRAHHAQVPAAEWKMN